MMDDFIAGLKNEENYMAAGAVGAVMAAMSYIEDGARASTASIGMAALQVGATALVTFAAVGAEMPVKYRSIPYESLAVGVVTSASCKLIEAFPNEACLKYGVAAGIASFIALTAMDSFKPASKSV